MVREDRVVMSGKELRRVPIIRQVVAKRLTQKATAAWCIGVYADSIRRTSRRLSPRWRSSKEDSMDECLVCSWRLEGHEPT